MTKQVGQAILMRLPQTLHSGGRWNPLDGEFKDMALTSFCKHIVTRAMVSWKASSVTTLIDMTEQTYCCVKPYDPTH